MTHRDTINDIGEIGAAVVIKGTFYPPGAKVAEGDRKIYLHIQGAEWGGYYVCTTGLIGCIIGWYSHKVSALAYLFTPDLQVNSHTHTPTVFPQTHLRRPHGADCSCREERDQADCRGGNRARHASRRAESRAVQHHVTLLSSRVTCPGVLCAVSQGARRFTYARATALLTLSVCHSPVVVI